MSFRTLGTAAPTPATPTPVRTIIHLGMNVHKNSITVAVLPEGAKAPTRSNGCPTSCHRARHRDPGECVIV